MKKQNSITIIALLISLLGVSGFTSDVNAQTIKQDSVVFYKDTIVKCYSGDGKWYIYSTDVEPVIIETISSDTFRIHYVFNKKNVLLKNITFDMQYFNTIAPSNTKFFQYKNKITDTTKDFSITDYNNGNAFNIGDANVKSIELKLSNLKWNGTAYLNIIFTNIVINYEYTDNTAINDVNNNFSQIHFINNKFESTTKIDNIKVFDLSGKLVQEGTINDTYMLEKNTLYFVLFDNKYSKKINIAN